LGIAGQYLPKKLGATLKEREVAWGESIKVKKVFKKPIKMTARTPINIGAKIFKGMGQSRLN